MFVFFKLFYFILSCLSNILLKAYFVVNVVSKISYNGEYNDDYNPK